MEERKQIKEGEIVKCRMKFFNEIIWLKKNCIKITKAHFNYYV